MCSYPDARAALLCARLSAVSRAIDELAADSHAGLPSADAVARVARIWTLLDGLDPDLDRCRERYGRRGT